MTESNSLPVEVCPNCGKMGAYISVVDGVIKTISCKCGYNAPGMAVVGAAVPAMGYRLFKADSAEELERKVVFGIGQGWKPQGGVSCSLAVEHETYGSSKFHGEHSIKSVIHELWSQAMVRA
jgi:hypothetical protein